MSSYRLHRLVLWMQKQKYSICSHVRHSLDMRAPVKSDIGPLLHKLHRGP